MENIPCYLSYIFHVSDVFARVLSSCTTNPFLQYYSKYYLCEFVLFHNYYLEFLLRLHSSVHRYFQSHSTIIQLLILLYKSKENIKFRNDINQTHLTWSFGVTTSSTTEMYSLRPVSVLCNFRTGGSIPHRNMVPKNSILCILKHI